MVAQALRLGPFTGGLNKASASTVVGDEELVDCLNLELDIDGSLMNRPAIQVIDEGSDDSRFLIFGSVVFSGTLYLFATRDGSTFVSSDEGVNWTELNPDANSRECTTMAVYGNTVWLPATPGSANGGIFWNTGGGAVAVADMPRGVNCVVHKNRLYIVPGENATSNESRLHFSDAADFTSWSGSGFIDVAQGDGTTLNNLVVFQDNLLLFKQESTHVLAYDLDPADAILREINPVVGSSGHFGVVQHENAVYVLFNSKVYEVINYDFRLLSVRLPFEFDSSLPTNTSARYEPELITLLGDRLVVRFFNRTYVYGLRTKTWSEWRKTDTAETVEWHVFGPLVRGEAMQGTGTYPYFTSYSFDMNDESGYKIIKIVEKPTVTDLEGYGTSVFHCIATTKDYDMADPVRFKRLMWWGADVITGNEILASVEPITLIFSPTWEELGDTTWANLGTWDSLVTTQSPIQTTVDADNNFDTNKIIKFRKSLRFRKVNFSVRLESDGTSLQPAKIFSYIIFVKTKQIVSQEVS